MPQPPKVRTAVPLIAMLTMALTMACAPTQQATGQPAASGMAAQQEAAAPQGAPAQRAMMPPGAMPGSPAMMASMHKMQQTMMAQPMTGNTDHDFASMMREHHRGAIDMARAELQNGTDPELQKMARKMITDQEKEIRQLDRWLVRHPAKPPQS